MPRRLSALVLSADPLWRDRFCMSKRLTTCCLWPDDLLQVFYGKKTYVYSMVESHSTVLLWPENLQFCYSQMIVCRFSMTSKPSVVFFFYGQKNFYILDFYDQKIFCRSSMTKRHTYLLWSKGVLQVFYGQKTFYWSSMTKLSPVDFLWPPDLLPFFYG